ncbi:transcription factor MYB101-like [Tripterygium wilfordii]|uniref:transcription factor MYB101-like n=1 Tax=Tripterygium wilfordii TaxID=458696 RepID=UPI0018F82685|nr:transcription factor MYB101-like [Tripterygium wilfordii]
MNHLKPEVNHAKFMKEECETITRLHSEMGNKWSRIAKMLPGRIDDQIKSYCRMMTQKRAKFTASYAPESAAASFSHNNTDIDSDLESVRELIGEDFERELIAKEMEMLLSATRNRLEKPESMRKNSSRDGNPTRGYGDPRGPDPKFRVGDPKFRGRVRVRVPPECNVVGTGRVW